MKYFEVEEGSALSWRRGRKMETNDDDREDQDLSEVVGRVGKGGSDGHGGGTVEGEHLVNKRGKSALFEE